jgi:hypothetical protein
MKAFPAYGPKQTAMIRNNLLMSAFSQPIELDGIGEPLYSQNIAAPHIRGLSTIEQR